MKPAKDATVAGGLSGLAAGLSLFMAVTVALGGEVLPVASLLAVGLLGVAVLAAWAAPGRVGAGVAGGVGATAPAIWLGCMTWLGEPVVVSHWRCGTGQAGVLLMAPGLFITAAVVGGAVMAVMASHRLRLVTGVGVAAGLMALAVLVPGGLVRAGNPEPAAWVETVPEVGVLPAVTTVEGPSWCTEGTGPRPGANCPLGYECADSRCQRRDAVEIDGQAFYRSCTPEGSCQVSFGAPTDTTDTTDTARIVGRAVEVASTAPVTVRRDLEHELWLVGDPFNVIAIDGATGLVVDVTKTELADSLAPPRGWVIAGAGGFVVSLLALLLAAVAWARARVARRARAGYQDAHGGVAFDDGLTPQRGVSTSPAAPGPVLATAEGRHRPPSYRAMEGPASWSTVAGDRVAIIARHELQMLAWLNVALSAAWITAAPLIAASTGGLLG